MKYSVEKIFELQDDWQQYMKESWQRGHDNLKFIEKSDQYAEAPNTSNKEQFVFNVSHKILKTAQANGKDIDLTLNIYSHGENDLEEKEAYKCLLHHIMLQGESRRQISASLDKVYSFGQSVFHVQNVREDHQSLNETLKIECIEDPTTVFFDKYALSPTFYDGNYCGRSRRIKGRFLKREYKKLANIVQDNEEYDIIDFWFKEKRPTTFIPVITGEYIRESLYKRYENKEKRYVRDKKKKEEKGYYEFIHYVRVMKNHDKPLEDMRYENLEILPMALDYGGMIWTGKKVRESFPLGWYLRDAQTLLNYAGSVIADILKSTNADRFFLTPDHVKTQEALNSAAEINEREGALLFTGDPSQIQRHTPQGLPNGLMEYFGSLPQLIENLAGSYVDGTNDQVKAMSGVALDKLFKRVDLVQNPFIVGHLATLNVVGHIVQKMIPTFYWQNRTLYIEQQDGTSKTLEINKPIKTFDTDETIDIENDVNKLNRLYGYSIKGAAAPRLQKQNLQTELQALYGLYPDAIPTTIDIYVKSLDVPCADVLARRLSVNMPRELIKYGNGEMTYGQYEQAMQQKQANQPPPPEAQYMQARAQGEVAKAQAAQSRAQTDAFKAQTERVKSMESSKNEHIKNVSNAVKIELEHEQAKAEQELQMAKAHLQQMDDIIESMGKESK